MINPQFNPFPVLETERLLLREMIVKDTPSLFTLRTDDIVMKYLDRPKCESLEAAEKFITKLIGERKANQNINWSITLKPEDITIGTICYWQLDKAHHRAEMGYNLLPAYHRKGIMHEAVQKVLEYGFNNMELHSVEAHVNPNNEGSIKLLEKNNFEREGYFKQNYYWQGKFTDTAVYSLIKPRFQKHK